MREARYVLRWRIRDEGGGEYLILPVMAPEDEAGKGERLHMRWIKDMFGSVKDSTKGIVNTEELWKAILGSFGVSSLAGVVVLVWNNVMAHADQVFVDPHTASLLSFAGLLVADLFRRRGDGVPAVALPPGSTVPESGAISPPPGSIPTVPPEAIPPEGLAPRSIFDYPRGPDDLYPRGGPKGQSRT